MNELAKCHCGGTAVLGASDNRVKRRGRAVTAVDELVRRSGGIPPRTGDDGKRYTRQMQEMEALAADVFEVRCKKCNAFVWAENEAAAVNRWNRALERLANLKPCCKKAKDIRTDYDGMVVARCEQCGSKHMPLKPQEA